MKKRWGVEANVQRLCLALADFDAAEAELLRRSQPLHALPGHDNVCFFSIVRVEVESKLFLVFYQNQALAEWADAEVGIYRHPVHDTDCVRLSKPGEQSDAYSVGGPVRAQGRQMLGRKDVPVKGAGQR